eukprot:TRINITY_DN11022_c0_g1_i3.p1 TRINITY_DN11022_c0_g1~~TRINITY_DN11022_c0_g1_i3.p1  ORF type:complete len:377 (+),score=88.24 TRINITY_DN11022_c0_g1_i3:54-1184(+)
MNHVSQVMALSRALFLLPAFIVGAQAKATLRDALLCAAHERVTHWYEAGEKPTTVKFAQDGIELRFLDEFLECGGEDSIVTFANFTVEGVKPIHVYSAIVNIVGQKVWNPAAHKIERLMDNEGQGVRGVKLLYFATPFQDRKVYEWETYDLTEGKSWLDATNLWFAATSGGSADLQAADTEVEDQGLFGMAKPVKAYSCLSAHHVRWAPDGKSVYASFTNTVNGKPPFNLAPTMISEMTWGKTVDFIKALRGQAQALAQLDDSQLWTPPDSLAGTPAKKYERTMNCQAMADSTPLQVMGLEEQTQGGYLGSLKEALSPKSSPRTLLASPTVLALCGCFAMAAAVAAALAIRRRLAASSLLRDEEEDACPKTAERTR